MEGGGNTLETRRNIQPPACVEGRVLQSPRGTRTRPFGRCGRNMWCRFVSHSMGWARGGSPRYWDEGMQLLEQSGQTCSVIEGQKVPPVREDSSYNSSCTPGYLHLISGIFPIEIL